METVGMALTTLRSNRLRSLLTMVGIVIGNASVITLVGVCLLYTSPSPRDH